MKETIYITSEEKHSMQREYERNSKYMEIFKKPPYQYTVEEVRTKGVSKSE